MIKNWLHQTILVNIEVDNLFADNVQIDRFLPILNQNPYFNCSLMRSACKFHVHNESTANDYGDDVDGRLKKEIQIFYTKTKQENQKINKFNNILIRMVV